MATEQHKPSSLDSHKLEFEEPTTELRMSDFAARKIAKGQRRAERGPSIFATIFKVYGEILFT